MQKALIAICVLAVLLSGCVPQVLADPADPQWDSDDIDHAYAVQSDAMLIGTLLVLSALMGFSGWIVFTVRRRR